jgi:hypothetical protein
MIACSGQVKENLPAPAGAIRLHHEISHLPLRNLDFRRGGRV